MRKLSEPMVLIPVRLPVELAEKFRKLCDKEGKTQKDMMIEAMAMLIESRDKKL